MLPEIEMLKQALESRELNRKMHWKTFQAAVRKARKISVTDEEIEILAEVDKQFFNQWNVPKISVFGASLILVVITLMTEIIYLSILSQTIPLANIFTTEQLRVLLMFLVYLIASGISYYTSHALIHFVIGRPLGIQFHKYFIFKASFRRMHLFKRVPPFSWFAKIPMWFGIKYDLETFLKASKWKRTVMFISAPILSNFWFILNYILLISMESSWKSTAMNIQLLFLLLILAFYIGSLVLSYFRFGDLWKARQDY